MDIITKPIWFWLPGQLQPVQAGVFTLDNGCGRFAYSPDYLARADRLPQI